MKTLQPSEVNWVHNGAINCCFVALLDLTNGEKKNKRSGRDGRKKKQ